MSTTPPERAGDPSPKPTARPTASRRQSKRLQRLREYEREVLDDPDALAANLGALNAGLIRIGHHLLMTTNAAFASSRSSLDDLPALLPAINACAQVTRQINRLVEFDRRLRGGATKGTPAASRKSLPKTGDGSGTVPSEGQSA